MTENLTREEDMDRLAKMAFIGIKLFGETFLYTLTAVQIDRKFEEISNSP
jgi:hypothetical protein